MCIQFVLHCHYTHLLSYLFARRVKHRMLLSPIFNVPGTSGPPESCSSSWLVASIWLRYWSKTARQILKAHIFAFVWKSEIYINLLVSFGFLLLKPNNLKWCWGHEKSWCCMMLDRRLLVIACNFPILFQVDLDLCASGWMVETIRVLPVASCIFFWCVVIEGSVLSTLASIMLAYICHITL